MDAGTWFMIAFYIIVVGGGGIVTLVRGLKDNGSWADSEEDSNNQK